MKTITIEATTISDAWFQCIWSLIDNGFTYKIEDGSFVGDKRLEFDFITVVITHPQTRPLEPDIPPDYGIPNPVEPGYIDKYVPYLMTAHKEPGEQYTYGSRLMEGDAYEDETFRAPDFPDTPLYILNWVNQVQHFIKRMREKPNGNQYILQVGQPSDCLLPDPPCVLPDSLIFTEDGYTKAKDIKEGDRLFTHKGRVKKVTKVFNRKYDGKINNISTKLRKTTLSLTPEHLVFVIKVDKCYDKKMTCKPLCKKQYSCYEKQGLTCKKSYKDYKEEWIDSKNITTNHFLPFPRFDYSYMPAVDISIEELSVMGLFLAEGDYSDGLRFSLGEHEEDLIITIISLMKKVYGLKPHIDNHGQGSSRIKFYSKELENKYRELFGAGARNKKIPFNFLSLSIEKLQAFIDSFIEGDGYRRINREQTNIFTTSEQMYKMFELILIKIGYMPSTSIVNIKDSNINGRVIKANGVGYNLSFIEKRTKDKYLWSNNEYFYIPINSISTVDYSGDVYNFEVEDDNSYIADNIVVHNCLRHIDMRIKDGELIFYPYFRSWDLWSGFPANLGGLVHLQEYMADEIGVKPGPFVCSSKGLHIYKYVWELAEIRTGKKVGIPIATPDGDDPPSDSIQMFDEARKEWIWVPEGTAYMPIKDFESVHNMLLLVDCDGQFGRTPKISEIESWTNQDRQEVISWAESVYFDASDNDVDIPEIPYVLTVLPKAAL